MHTSALQLQHAGRHSQQAGASPAKCSRWQAWSFAILLKLQVACLKQIGPPSKPALLSCRHRSAAAFGGFICVDSRKTRLRGGKAAGAPRAAQSIMNSMKSPAPWRTGGAGAGAGKSTTSCGAQAKHVADISTAKHLSELLEFPDAGPPACCTGHVLSVKHQSFLPSDSCGWSGHYWLPSGHVGLATLPPLFMPVYAICVYRLTCISSRSAK